MSSFIDLQLLAIQAGAGSTQSYPLYMWGDNTYGQLGDNKEQNYFSWNSLYSGKGSHSFAIRSDNTLWGWGLNSNGQLGDGTTISKSSPVQIGVSSWTQVSIGQNFTLGISADNKLYGWGSNRNGQLGDNTTINKSAPTYITANSWISVSAGGNHSTAIRSDNTLWSWGYNSSGQLGDSTIVDKSYPVQIDSNTYSSVSAGTNHTTAIDTNSILYVWGINTLSQLGLSDTISRSNPTQLGSSSYSLVSAGGTHTMAVKTDSSLLAWGNNLYGQLGNNPTFSGYYWTQIADSENHTVALRNDGALFTWGYNDVGQLGLGDTVTRSSPVQIGTSSYVSVSAGLSYNVAIDINSKLYTWGVNQAYQLGDGTTINRSTPVQIASTLSWSQVNAGKSHAFAIGKNYELFGWGDNTYGQIGTSGVIATSWTTISFGTSHALGIRNDGLLFAWGLNAAGQLGIGLTTSRSSPVQIGTESWTYVSTGESHSMGIKTDGTLWTWGLNTSGQLGISFTTNRSSPVQVSGSYINITGGGAFSLAIDSSSLLYGWGLNSSGQLGLNDLINRSSPNQIGTSSYSQISAGTDFSLAVKSDSTLFAWGNNNTGQLAQTDTVNRSNPVQIAGSYSVVSAGASTAYAIESTSKSLYGWGLGNAGQLLAGAPTGYASYYFNGAVGISIMAGVAINTPVFPTTTSLFTVECWVYQSSYDTVGGVILAQAGGFSQDVRLLITDGYQRIEWNSNSYTSTIRLSLNTWTHLAYVRDTTTTIKGYTNGVLGVTATFVSGIISVVNSELGSRANATNTTLKNTYVSNLRVTTKVVYTGNFTVPTGPLTLTQAAGTNITEIFNTDVKLLTLQSSQLIDTSLNSYTLTNPAGAWASASKVTFSTNYPTSFPAPATNFSVASILSTSSYTNVSAGSSHVVAQDSADTLWVWGLNSSGQLGDNTTITRSSPVQIGSYILIASSNRGTSSVGEAPGAVFLWGNNASGQLGSNTTVNRSSPTVLSTTVNSTNYISPVRIGTSSWSQVSAGYSHTVGIETDYTMWAWGLGTSGALGNNSIVSRSSPVQIGSSSWTKVSAGEQFALALDLNNTVYAWGLNSSGQLGINLTTNRSNPVQISASAYFNDVSAGSSHSAAISENYTLYTWGNNLLTQLGNTDSSIVYRSMPTQVSSTTESLDTRFIKLNAYDNSTMAIDNLGNIYGWGDNSYSIFETPTQYYSWTQLSNGDGHSLAIRSDGRLFAWGLNSSGQLGDNTTISKSSPIQIFASPDITISVWNAISAGTTHSVAIANDSRVFTWGFNTQGQLGTSDTISRSTPVQVATPAESNYSYQYDGTSKYLSIASNAAFGFGTGDFTIEAWIYINSTTGINLYDNRTSQFGNGINLNITGNPPVPVYRPQGVNQITGSSLSFNTWYHIAYVRISGVTTMYVNGTQSGSSYTDTQNIGSANPIYIGANYNIGSLSDGYISNLRVIKGTGLYTGGFYPSTGILTLTSQGATASQVSLLTAQSATIVDNSLNAFSITNTGTVTTTISNPFGPYYSASFNGTNQYLTLPSSTYITSGGDYTIEFWCYSRTSGSGDAGCMIYTTASGIYQVVMRNNGSAWECYYSNNAKFTNVPTSTIPLNQWHHMALVRISGTVKWYINGTQYGSVSGVTNTSSTIQIGMYANFYYDGYISNIRIVTGVGVYTGAFTPPTNILRTTQSAMTNIVALTGTETSLLTLQNATIVDNSVNAFTITNNNTVITTSNIAPFSASGASANMTALKISAGTNFTMAIKSDSTLWSWGFNTSYQLGIDDIISRSSPVQIGSSSWSQVSTGASHALAIDVNNSVYGWGSSTYGQAAPTKLISWTQITAAVGGSSSTPGMFAIRSDGLLFAWGANGVGQLGTNDVINRSSPVQIGTSSWSFVTSNTRSTFAISIDSTLWAWGSNGGGALGTNDVIDRSSPVQIDTNSWSTIGAFGTGAAAIKIDGSLWTWGINLYGTLGLGNVIYRSSPVQVGSSSWTSVASGGQLHLLAIDAVGRLFAWGYNLNGQLGDGTVANKSSPVQIGSSSWTQVTAGYDTSAAITNNGNLFGWGANNYGQLGQNNTINRSSPVQIATGTSFTMVSVANFNSAYTATMYGITTSNTLLAWGAGNAGQIGNTTTINRSSPVQVGTLSTWYKISGSMGIDTAGSLFTWGYNNQGQLGTLTSTSSSRSSPAQVGTSIPTIITNPTKIDNNSYSLVSAGGSHSMAIDSNSNLYGWGLNDVGQLGLNDTINRSSTLAIIGNSSWTSVSAGKDFTIGILSNSTLYSWGRNTNGQLGLNDTVNRSSPVQVNTAIIPSNSDPNTYSLSFNGITQYLSLPSDASFAFGTGNFTIEFWFYANAIAVQSMFDLRDPNTAGTGFDLYMTTTGSSIRFGTTGTTYITGTTVIVINNWYHLALSRSGATTYQMFLNGVQEGLTYSTTQNFTNNSPRVGNGVNGFFNGYISNLRVIKGQGIYTTTFTPSTSPLTAVTDTVLLTAQNATVVDNSTNNFTIDNFNNVTYSLLTPFSTNATASDVSAGGSHSSIASSNNLYAWGLNSSGQLGINTVVSRSSPVQVSVTTVITAISPVLVTSGDYSSYYQSSPIQIGSSSWSTVSAGNNHSLGKLTNNTLFAWGLNNYGQLGDSSTINRSSPVQIASGNFTNVNAGDNFSSLRKNDNTIYLFGENDVGQIGDLT